MSFTLKQALAVPVGRRVALARSMKIDCSARCAGGCVSPSHWGEATLARFGQLVEVAPVAPVAAPTEEEPADEAADGANGGAKDADEEVLVAAMTRAIAARLGIGPGRGSFWDRVRAEAEKAAAAAAKTLETRVVWDLKLPSGEVNSLDADEVRHAVFPRLLRLASAGVPGFLVGPSGCGKSFVVEQVARALKRPFGLTSFSAATTESAITGRLLGIEGTYVESVPHKMFRTGGVWCADELDAADAGVLLAANPLMDPGTKSLTIDRKPGDPTVVRHADYWACGTANTNGSGPTRQFAGRCAQDGAMRNRLSPGYCEMGFDPRVEKQVTDPEVYGWGVKVRAAIEKAKLFGSEHTMSTRYLVQASRIKATEGATFNDWAYGFFGSWTVDDRKKVRAIDAGLIPASCQ